MERLRRETQSTETDELRVRVEGLERRIFMQPTRWAYVALRTPQEIGAFSSEFLAIDLFWTSAPEIFSTAPDGVAGDTQVRCAQFGVYVVTLTTEWEDIGADYPHQCSIGEGRLIGANLAALGASAVSASVLEYPPTGTKGPLDVGDASIGIHSPWDYSPTQPAFWQMTVNNGHSVAVDVLRANMMIAYLPSDEPEKDYVQYD